MRLIPFKDHINIEAQAAQHGEELAGYKFTPKVMVQVITDRDILREAPRNVFAETLG